MKEKLIAARTLPVRLHRLLGQLLEHDAIRTAGACLAVMAMSFLLAGARMAGQALPLAVCMTAASGSALNALAAMLGGSMGYLYFWGFTGGLESVAVGVLVFAAVCIVGGGELAGTPWFMPAMAAVFSLLVGLLFLAQARFAAAAVVWYAARALLAAAATWGFRLALDRRGAGLFLLGCLINGAAAVTLAAGVTLGQIAAVAVGSAIAGAPGCLLLCVVAGLAVDIAALPPVSLTALLSFGAAAALWAPFRLRAARMLVFLTAVVAGVLFTGGQMPELVPAAALGCCVGIFLPASRLPVQGVRGEESARRSLEQAAAVFSGIRSQLEGGQKRESRTDAAAIFDRASDRVCGSCVLWAQCWQQRSTETYHALCSVARPMLQRGAVVRDDFPRDFTEKCCRMDALMTAINRELDELACRRQYDSRLEESRVALVQQYSLMEAYLHRAAGEVDTKSPAAVFYTPELGVSMCGKDGHTISGDRGACFRTPDGMYYLLLCDGMGTGPEAAAEGKAAIRTVAGLIRAGLEPDGALEMLNSIYVLRDDGIFSTVDLVAVSLVTGEAALYKWGAAPSFWRRADGTEKIGTAAPPPGFGVGETHKAAEYRLSLRNGEMLVLLSDGAGGEDAGRQIATWGDGSPKELAAALIARAQANGEDDMTALALRLRPCTVRL